MCHLHAMRHVPCVNCITCALQAHACTGIAEAAQCLFRLLCLPQAAIHQWRACPSSNSPSIRGREGPGRHAFKVPGSVHCLLWVSMSCIV